MLCKHYGKLCSNRTDIGCHKRDIKIRLLIVIGKTLKFVIFLFKQNICYLSLAKTLKHALFFPSDGKQRLFLLLYFCYFFFSCLIKMEVVFHGKETWEK